MRLKGHPEVLMRVRKDNGRRTLTALPDDARRPLNSSIKDCSVPVKLRLSSSNVRSLLAVIWDFGEHKGFRQSYLRDLPCSLTSECSFSTLMFSPRSDDSAIVRRQYEMASPQKGTHMAARNAARRLEYYGRL